MIDTAPKTENMMQKMQRRVDDAMRFDTKSRARARARARVSARASARRVDCDL